MKRDFIFPRFCMLILLPAACLLMTRCANKIILSKAVIPAPHPVSYSGAAPDSGWLDDQTAAYKKQGVPDSTAELTARLEFEREKTGDTTPILAQVSGPPMGPQKQSKNSMKGAIKGAEKFFTPKLPPPPPMPTAAPTPEPQTTPTVVQVIPVAPAVPSDDTTTTTTTTTRTPPRAPPPPRPQLQ